ncbi:MAG TPA: hypothetical protein VGW40_02700 [Allosphingosinicella sp.]|nr:hypothetical protein [Allosphingosinicella sp.]
MANLHHAGGDSDPIVVTANLGYFTVQAAQDDNHMFPTAAADYMAWTPENVQYMPFVNQALQYLAQSPVAMQLLWAALQAGVTIKIVTGDSPTQFNNQLNQVEWNPGLGYRLTGGGIMSPAMALIHELAHGVDRIILTQYDPDYGTIEERRVIVNYEQVIATLLGEPTRQDHNVQAVHVPSVIYHTPNLPPPG